LFQFPYGTHELAYGGAAYILGIILFKGDGKIPFAHALWHVCTLIGTSFHYYAIFTYLMTAHR
jgi:monocyte-to-macrophage differentiation protein